MSRQRPQKRACRRVPDTERRVLAYTRYGLSIRMERDAVDGTGVPCEGVQYLTCVYIPDMERFIMACARQRFAIGAKEKL